MIRSAPQPSSSHPQTSYVYQPRRMPVCASCGHKMRPKKIEPHARLRNINIRILACDCGNTARDLVANGG